MRSKFRAQRLLTLSQTTAIAGLAALLTACSNGATRLDTMFTGSIAETPNQQTIIDGQKNVVQPYPGDVVTSTRTGVQIVKRAEVADSYSRQPLVPSVGRSELPSVSAPVSVERTAVNSVPEFPKQATPSAPPVKSSAALVLKPRATEPAPLKVLGTDPITTGTVSPVTAKEAVKSETSKTKKPAGWQSSQGTWVTVKSGETLYNLSRRYGVPVMAIMSANKLQDANQVSAGSRVLIPMYTYSKNAPVSAPDNNPITKAARASRGFEGQAKGKVALPKERVAQPEKPVVAKVAKPARNAAKATGDEYTVQSGDTLYAIARRHGIRTSALKSANSLSSDNLRLGQKLVIPEGGGQETVDTTKSQVPIDPVTTGSIPERKAEGKSVKPVTSKAPTSIEMAATEKVKTVAKTSAGNFRWPAKGRLISKFGERNQSGANDGIDISVPVGTPVKASENGTVIYSGSELEDFGKLILLSHSGGWVSAYAHASTTLVRRGDKVKRGQVIAKSGRSGNAAVPKLHFELRKNSNPVNPLKHLSR